MKKDLGRPIPGKQYALTSASGIPSILNGNTWAESEVKPIDGIRSVCSHCGGRMVNGMCDAPISSAD